MAADALLVTHLNKSDGDKNAPKLRDTWFMRDGQRVAQLMQLSSGVQKGLQRILTERGLWLAGGMKVPNARLLLAEQPHFKAQKGRGRLVERILGAEQYVLMLPKYHCEFNFIENLWGRMKVDLRRNCSYDFAALHQSIPAAVASVPLAVLRRYARRCERTMDAYRPMVGGQLLTPSQVAVVVKMYKSHRCISRSMASLFPELAPEAQL